MDKEFFLIKRAEDWAGVQDAVGNAVVQVFAQVSEFNWVEPYRTDEQHENRGSGFLINADGYLITNAHVVHEAKRVWIHMPALGQHNIHALIVGFCPERDIALLRINPSDLEKVREQLGAIPFVTFGNSDLVRRTDPILALGYPLGQYRLKSTTGVVSGRESGSGQAFLQITAPVNPGSSGGPLLNMDGQVIGITIAGFIEAQNVGYAIPINELTMILEDLYTQRLVRRPMLGARFIFSCDDKAQYFGNPRPSGLYISRILPGSPLEKAGVQVGDMLYELNGFPIDAYGDTSAPWGADRTSIYDLIARIKVGETVQLGVYRAGERKNFTFTAELMPLYPIRQIYPDYEPVEYEIIGGLVVMELRDNHIPYLFDRAPELIRYYAPEHKTEAKLVITHVMPGSLAHQLRTLAAGDILQEVNSKEVHTLDNFRRLVRKSIQTGFLTLKTRRDVFAVFALKRVLDDEARLSSDLTYPISPLVTQLVKLVKKEAR
jgi:serine protease Do